MQERPAWPVVRDGLVLGLGLARFELHPDHCPSGPRNIDVPGHRPRPKYEFPCVHHGHHTFRLEEWERSLVGDDEWHYTYHSID